MASQQRKNNRKPQKPFKKKAKSRTGVKNANTTNYNTSFRGKTKIGANKKINKGANQRANFLGFDDNKNEIKQDNDDNNDDNNDNNNIWMQENKENDQDKENNDNSNGLLFNWPSFDNNNNDNDNNNNDNNNNKTISPQLLSYATQIKDMLDHKNKGNQTRNKYQLSRNKYLTVRMIEKGEFDEIRVIRDKVKKKLYCLKMIKRKSLKYKKCSKLDKSEPNWKQIERDIVNLHQESINVINVTEIWRDSEYIHIAMEKCDINLGQILLRQDTPKQETLQFYFLEIVNGINEIHNLGFIHRELKPSHILISRQGCIKISDYGLQKYFDNQIDQIINKYKQNEKNLKFDENEDKDDDKRDENKKDDDKKDDDNNNDPFMFSWSCLGFNANRNNESVPKTVCYLSPDIFNTIKTYDRMTDWWSLGIILYQCLMGNVPFNSKKGDEMEICHKIINYKKWINIDELVNFIVDYDVSVIDLLSKLICAKRIRFGYQQIIKHHWFKVCSVYKIYIICLFYHHIFMFCKINRMYQQI